LNPLRGGIIKKAYQESVESFTELERENIRTWGYPYVMDCYVPHCTVISLENESDATSAANAITLPGRCSARSVVVRMLSTNDKGEVTKNTIEFILG
jgi:Protein of unknown function (DUF1045)